MQYSLIMVMKARDDKHTPHLIAKLLLKALEVALCFIFEKKSSGFFLHLNERSRERESQTSLTLILRPAGEKTWEYKSSGKMTVKASYEKCWQ